MKRAVIASVAVAVGSAVTAIGAVVALPLFGASLLGLLPLVVGALLLIGGSLLTPSSTSSSSSSSWRVTRLAPVLGPIVLVAGLWAVHRLGAAGLERDITAAQTNTLAEESIAVARDIAALDKDVVVVSFVDDDRARAELGTLLARYRAIASNLRVEERSAKTAADLDVARALGIAEHLALGGPNVVVVGHDEAIPPVRLRYVAELPDREQLFTNALRRATTTTTTRVYLLFGHGEPDTRDEGPVGLSRLTASLAARGVQLVPLPLASVGRLPDDARALVVLPALTPIDDAEQAIVVAAVDRGVPVFVAVEPDRPSPLSTQIAGSLGVDVVDDVVVDESPFAAMLGGADVANGQTQLAHAVTRSLRGALTHFPRAAVLGLTPIGDEADVVVTPLVSTGSDARAHKTKAEGPLPLLVGVERTTPVKTRALVAADASFLSNVELGKGANSDLALNAVLWLTSTDDLIVVRPHTRTGALVFLTPAARERLSFVLLVLVPGLLLALAAGRSAARRAR